MSLYYETSTLLTAPNSHTGSLKSRIFNRPAGKSSPGQIYALVTEVSKWSSILKEVIDKAGVLALEPKVF
jgi:25S rRNA (cytosine2278-C5)-methyltransferase